MYKKVEVLKMVSYYNTNNPYIMPYTTDQVFNNPYYNPYLPNGGYSNQVASTPVVSTYIPNQAITSIDTYNTDNKGKSFDFSNWYSTNKERISKFLKGAFISGAIIFGGFLTLRATRFIQPSESKNISNFHTVSTFSKNENRRLYRGAQPDYTDDNVINEFREKNIKLVIDFRNEKTSSKEDMKAEKETFKKNGIKYINFPMESGDVPNKQEYEKFQKIINAHKKDGSIFIHCKSGIDRTGVMSAMYQMKNNGKTKQQAYETMKDCGYNIYHQTKYKKLTEFMKKE